jgi:phosphoglycerol transferase MdoB-like AlkP superfamily enzyme
MSRTGFSNIIKPHANVTLSLKAVLLLMAVFTLLRFVFFLFYYSSYTGVDISDIALSFIIGLRFDLASVIMIGGLFFLLLNLPGDFKFSKGYRISVLSIFYLVFTAALTVSIGDIYYYQFSKRRISYEIFNLTKFFPELLTMVLDDYLFQLIVLLIFVVLFGYVWFKILGKQKKIFGSRIVNDIIYFVVILASIVISIRGGLQLKPLRESYAFRNENIALGHLSLNAVFTAIRTLNRGDLKEDTFYPVDEAKKTVNKLLNTNDELFLKNNYPLMRRFNFVQSGVKKMNVVIIVMESWSGNLINHSKLAESPTPFFNKLTKEGVYYENFYAAGQRTIQGMQAIISSIPNVAYDDILGSPIEQNSLRPLGFILKENGYSNIFIHGARPGSMGFEAFSKLSGFDRYISKSDFDLKKVKDDGTWGIFDHYVFERANYEFDRIGKPFLGVIMTLTSHAPYALPFDDFKYYDSTVTNSKFLNSLRYSDWSLEKFFEAAKKSDYYQNTLFVIVADHAEGTGEKTLNELFKIPCLFYSPGKLPPRIDYLIHSQVDILPSILHLLNMPAVHSSFGVSMFVKKDGFAFIPSGNLLGWVRSDWILIADREKNIGLYNIKTDSNLKFNRLNEGSSVAKEMRKDMLSYLQLSVYLLRENKVFIN